MAEVCTPMITIYAHYIQIRTYKTCMTYEVKWEGQRAACPAAVLSLVRAFDLSEISV